MLTFTLLLLSLAAVGTAAWALGESVVQSNSVISDFWDLVYEVQTKVGGGEYAGGHGPHTLPQ